ncbi:hypothetical protein CC79DRAFT_1321108 [Sarocladium strictum]
MDSEPFEIIAHSDGEKSQECYIHSGLLSNLPPSLNALVNGSMREAREKYVTWNLPEGLFGCFIKLAYKGKYKATACAYLDIEQPIEYECTDADFLSGLSTHIVQ